jgi:hypothetical protein
VRRNYTNLGKELPEGSILGDHRAPKEGAKEENLQNSWDIQLNILKGIISSMGKIHTRVKTILIPLTKLKIYKIEINSFLSLGRVVFENHLVPQQIYIVHYVSESLIGDFNFVMISASESQIL